MGCKVIFTLPCLFWYIRYIYNIIRYTLYIYSMKICFMLIIEHISIY
jgi:hypothetical protein